MDPERLTLYCAFRLLRSVDTLRYLRDGADALGLQRRGGDGELVLGENAPQSGMIELLMGPSMERTREQIDA